MREVPRPGYTNRLGLRDRSCEHSPIFRNHNDEDSPFSINVLAEILRASAFVNLGNSVFSSVIVLASSTIILLVSSGILL